MINQIIKSSLAFLMLVTMSLQTNVHSSVTANELEESVNEVKESFTIDIYETDEEGFHQVVGYKEVKSSTIVTQKENEVKTEIYAYEESYDLEDNHLGTELIYEEAINDFEEGTLLVKEGSQEESEFRTMSLVTEENVKNYVDAQIDKDSLTSEELDGLTGKEADEIQEELSESVGSEANFLESPSDNEISTSSTLSAGAFDNYYNISGSEYTVATLSYASGIYFIAEGPTLGNASVLNEFQDYIDSYEYNVIQSMNYATNVHEVTAWARGIATFVRISVTVAGGPSGWATAATITTLAAWTTDFYASYARLGYSQNAARELDNARELLAATSRWNYDSWSTFNGFQ